MTQAFVGLEIIKYHSVYDKAKLYYWHREAQNSNAEVDFIFAKSNSIVPVEVKAGTKGSMQSMFLFLNEKKCEKGIRISNENFTSYNNINVYPIYAVENVLKE